MNSYCLDKKYIFLLAVFFATQPFLRSQSIADSIREQDVARVIQFLAGDSLKGRGNGSKDLLKAGIYIGDQFRDAGLRPLIGMAGYFIPFQPFGGPKHIAEDSLIWNGQLHSPDHFFYLHRQPGNYRAKSLADFTVIHLDSFFSEDIVIKADSLQKDLLIWSDKLQPGQSTVFPEKFKMPANGIQHDLLFVYAPSAPESILLAGNSNYYKNTEYNVVSMLIGKSKPTEIIIFSAHYDHEGVTGDKKKDSIMNGANDNASGTTALLMLAKYFAQRNNNERTLVFCAFAGEELGLIGSKDFVQFIKADRIVAGINLEMLGVPQYGKKRVFITGESYSSLPDILKKEFKKQGLRLLREPDPEKLLFYRSDNSPFARNGVPAHTIMASDDDDGCYHQPCDELRRIDIPNLTFITQAIAKACATLVNGTATPSRINVNALKSP